MKQKLLQEEKKSWKKKVYERLEKLSICWTRRNSRKFIWTFFIKRNQLERIYHRQRFYKPGNVLWIEEASGGGVHSLLRHRFCLHFCFLHFMCRKTAKSKNYKKRE